MFLKIKVVYVYNITFFQFSSAFIYHKFIFKLIKFKMTWLQTIILLILIFIIACLVNIGITYSMRDELKKRLTDVAVKGSAEDDTAANELLMCSQEINDKAGGAEKILSLNI